MRRKKQSAYILGFISFFLMVLTACAPVEPVQSQLTEAPLATATEVIEIVTEQPVPTNTPEPEPSKPEPTLTHVPTETVDVSVQEEQVTTCDDPFEEVRVRFSTQYWEKTNFCKHSVDYSEFLSGGPPPDGIPAIDDPNFESISDADQWIGDNWPVMYFEWNGDARAYPLAILMWHEIVNDEVGGLPVALTFCPLCNATIVFNRTLPDGTVLDFGTSGNLRNSDLVMYDRQTQSWWQQFTGTAIVGDLTDTQLEFLPSQIIAWSDFREIHPEGLVLSRDTGFSRDYGRNPYVGYDSIQTNPFLFDGVVDGRLPPTSRVVAVEISGVNVAYPFSELSLVQVVNDDIGDQSIVVFWQAGTNSALDASSFDDARDIGATSVFDREVDGQLLTFKSSGDAFMDEETGSLWNIFGEATEGPLEGTQLDQLVSAEHFWFAWAAFKPDTIIWSSSG